jgi:CP family cyanate transporter-like MFS transporter
VTGPLLFGLLESATGGWAVPVWVLIGVTIGQLVAGVLAGRAITIGPAT